jgi:CxxC motif-containing protein (DUF1111 family)
MKWANPSLYVFGALITLGPAGLRMLTWPTPQEQPLDTSMVQEGRKLFLHEFKPNDPLCNGGDGLGPVFNASSCVACHRQGGIGGGGGLEHNVTTFIVQTDGPKPQPRQGVVHAQATHRSFQETLADVHPQLPRIPNATAKDLRNTGRVREGLHALAIDFHEGNSLVHVSQRNTPALFGAGLIDQLPDRFIIAMERQQRLRRGLATPDTDEAPVGRAFRLPDGRIGKFGWKAHSASLGEFVQAACANELGLGNPGHAQPRPLGVPTYQPVKLDLTLEQCNQMTTFIASLNRPEHRMPNDPLACERAARGKQLFHKIGCAECHTPNIGSIEGVYSDFLLHRMGDDLQGSGTYFERPSQPPSPGDSPLPDEWRTPPLWGVADSAPYLHDGRARTLEEAITLHGGQAAHASRRFQQLSPTERACVVDFLKTLRAPAN